MITALLEALAHFVVSVISTLGYAGIVLTMAIESACIPLPSEIIMPFSGYLVTEGRFTLMGIALAGAVGNLLGSWAAYAVGYYGGVPFIKRFGRYFLLSMHDYEISKRWFDKYGDVTVFATRMLPAVRTFISLPAGVARMPLIRFSVYSFIGAFLWSYLLGWIGFRMGANWAEIRSVFHQFDIAIGIVLLIGIVWYIRRHLKVLKKENA